MIRDIKVSFLFFFWKFFVVNFLNFILIFKFTLLYWFWQISKLIRHRYTCVSPSWTLLPPPSPYHYSGSSQCTSPKHPVSCIESGLATRFIYDIIHVSVPFSQIIPPSPSPTESKRLFYTSVYTRQQKRHWCKVSFLIHNNPLWTTTKFLLMRWLLESPQR